MDPGPVTAATHYHPLPRPTAARILRRRHRRPQTRSVTKLMSVNDAINDTDSCSCAFRRARVSQPFAEASPFHSISVLAPVAITRKL